MSYTAIHITMLIGYQQKVYNLYDVHDKQLINFLLQVKKYWPDNTPKYWFDFDIQQKPFNYLVKEVNCSLKCLTQNNEINKPVPYIIPQDLIDKLCNKSILIPNFYMTTPWANKQFIYVVFTPTY